MIVITIRMLFTLAFKNAFVVLIGDPILSGNFVSRSPISCWLGDFFELFLACIVNDHDEGNDRNLKERKNMIVLL